MTDEEVMQKNLTLSFEFSLYVTEHPEFARKIPKDSRVVLLPGDDPELARINQEIAKKAKRFDDEPNRSVILSRSSACCRPVPESSVPALRLSLKSSRLRNLRCVEGHRAQG